MSPATERTIGAVILASLLGAWAYQAWIIQPEKERQRSHGKAETSQRFQQWAYIAKSKEIAPGESIRMVVIPHPVGIDILDTKCLIYTHQEFKVSQMLCPDAKQSDIEEHE